ncbi:phosphomannomutase [Psychrobacter sp. K31L]|uniref:phosphomannomutase n=1 Tax=Psychrobacter sp. K31L TaxID=2820758 RepID=UPI001B3453E1|nr:phosphomannomutase [Psychrobacter sp. K31L]MBP3946836.1 phosphomannomutase [Psychrobacter sp. K31L]
MPFFATQQSLFRAYDIRGDEQYFTPDFIQALGAAFVRLYKNHNAKQRSKPISNSPISSSPISSSPISSSPIANSNVKPHHKPKETTVIIGYDVRCGSDSMAQSLASILQKQGLQVINLGLITTPMMAFWTEQYAGHGIMVTASHSAKGILGLKWLVGNTSPSAKDIQMLYQDLIAFDTNQHHNQIDSNSDSLKLPSTSQSNDKQATSVLSVIGLPTDTVATPYIDAIAEVFVSIYPKQNLSASNKRTFKKLDLTIVIDCMHGATSRIALPLFTTFCQRVIIINDTPDGNFPMGNPDPTEPNRLAELQQNVIVNTADIGLAFDGDGDRLMIVDNSGKIVMPDHLLYLLASVAMSERPETWQTHTSSPQVLFDIKCSHHLPILLSDLGATPILSKTGSSLMRQQLQADDSQILFAGELSGHFIFNDGYFTAHDDAMYAGLRLLHWLAYTATHRDKSSAAVGLWGEPIEQSRPIRLTDITHQLPMLVSTADHYLPLPSRAPLQCPIVQQLAEFCCYLQCLVAAPSDDLDSTLTAAYVSSQCTCVSSSVKQTTLAQAKQLLPSGTQLTCIDGVRLDFAHGFGVLRQSNTSHHLTVRFAGDSLTDLKDIQARFVALCRPFDKHLAEQIAALLSE